MESLPFNENNVNFGGSHYGAKAISSPSGDGIVVQSYEFLYQLTCQNDNEEEDAYNSCSWTKMSERLTHGLRWGIMTYLPRMYSILFGIFCEYFAGVKFISVFKNIYGNVIVVYSVNHYCALISLDDYSYLGGL